MPKADKEALTIEPWAAGIGLGMLGLILCLAIFTLWNRAHTSDLEQALTPTAVGDMHFFTESKGNGPSGLRYQRRELLMNGSGKIRDSKMIRTGVDDSGKFTIYKLEEEKGGKERLFLKTAEDEYVEVKPGN